MWNYIHAPLCADSVFVNTKLLCNLCSSEFLSPQYIQWTCNRLRVRLTCAVVFIEFGAANPHVELDCEKMAAHYAVSSWTASGISLQTHAVCVEEQHSFSDISQLSEEMITWSWLLYIYIIYTNTHAGCGLTEKVVILFTKWVDCNTNAADCETHPADTPTTPHNIFSIWCFRLLNSDCVFWEERVTSGEVNLVLRMLLCSHVQLVPVLLGVSWLCE